MIQYALAIAFLLSIAAAAAASDLPAGLEKVCGDLKFPEGPAWDGKNSVYVSNCNGRFITKADVDGTVEQRWMSMPGEEAGFETTNGMTFHRDGTLYACDFEASRVVRIRPDKTFETYVSECDGKSFNAPNDLAFAPNGDLYFTDPGGSSRDKPTGCVYRVESESRKVTRVADGMAFPNGLAFTADGKALYVCESQRNRILAFAVNDDGSLTARQVFADLSADGAGEPDGMAVDSAGHLWVTHYGAHSVLEVDQKGKIVRTIRLPHDNEQGPTNLEFGGGDLKTLYITDPGKSALYRMRVERPGLRLFCSPGSGE